MRTLLAVILAGLMSLEASQAAAQTRFGVGVTSRVFVDGTRPTHANEEAPASQRRVLVTEIWYPAANNDPSLTEETDAPLAPGGPFPLVFFVHGLTGGRRDSTFLTQALAAAGYVVVAADFPLTADVTPGGASDWHAEEQPHDLSFLANVLTRLGAKDPLAGAIDAGAGYAVVGHSTGGTVALLAAEAPDFHDERVRAAVVLAGDSCFFGDSFFSTRPVPLFFVDATRDLLVPAPTNGNRAYGLAGAPKLHLLLRGGTHLYFNDEDLPDEIMDPTPTTTRDPLARTLAKYGGGTACEPIPPPADDPPLPLDEQHDLTAAAVRAFLDSVMHGQKDELRQLLQRRDPRAEWEADGLD